jgi:outer membrane protein OmpA-like peptidoglycan-associated protein
LPDTAVEAPLFASNDANLRARGTQILDDVVACMKAGLFGEQILLAVGYADARGAPLYNEALALERARAAQRYLIWHGVPPERIEVASRGARDALGEAPESWMYDRRVEIRLLPKPEGVAESDPARKPVPQPDSEPEPER